MAIRAAVPTDEHRRESPGTASNPAGVPLQAANWLVRTLGRGRDSPLNDQDVLALASALEVRRLPAGKLLYPEAALPDGVWALQRGEVQLATGLGRRRSIVQVLGEGDVVGDVYLLLETPPPVNARTSLESETLFMSAERFRRLLRERPNVSALWLASACRRAVRSDLRVLELLVHGIPSRVARLVLRQSTDGVLNMSQASVAQMLGTGRPSVNRALRHLQREGAVSLAYGRIIVLDHERLRRAAGVAGVETPSDR